MAINLAITHGSSGDGTNKRGQQRKPGMSYHDPMEQKPRLGRSMSIDEVAELLGWTEAEKAAHLRALDDLPFPDLEEAKARLAARTK